MARKLVRAMRHQADWFYRAYTRKDLDSLRFLKSMIAEVEMTEAKRQTKSKTLGINITHAARNIFRPCLVV